MSFQSKVDEAHRSLTTVKKDLRTREDQARKGDPTFFTDSQIKGGFSELVCSLLCRISVYKSYRGW